MDNCFRWSYWSCCSYLSNHQTVKILKFSRFILLFISFMALLAAGPLISTYYFQKNDFLIPYFWELFSLFGILTFVIYSFASWRMQISNKASGQAILASVTIKLLFCMVLAFIYLYNIDTDPSKFLLNFFYLYFFHTVFEIYCLLCNLRNQKIK